jgi:hypothetical protein
VQDQVIVSKPEFDIPWRPASLNIPQKYRLEAIDNGDKDLGVEIDTDGQLYIATFMSEPYQALPKGTFKALGNNTVGVVFDESEPDDKTILRAMTKGTTGNPISLKHLGIFYSLTEPQKDILRNGDKTNQAQALAGNKTASTIRSHRLDISRDYGVDTVGSISMAVDLGFVRPEQRRLSIGDYTDVERKLQALRLGGYTVNQIAKSTSASANDIAAFFAHIDAKIRTNTPEISERRQDILDDLMLDMSYKSIAARRHIAWSTVRSHAHALFKRFQAGGSRPEFWLRAHAFGVSALPRFDSTPEQRLRIGGENVEQ